jgi:hypothetical protein
LKVDFPEGAVVIEIATDEITGPQNESDTKIAISSGMANKKKEIKPINSPPFALESDAASGTISEVESITDLNNVQKAALVEEKLDSSSTDSDTEDSSQNEDIEDTDNKEKQKHVPKPCPECRKSYATNYYRHIEHV